MLTALTLAAVVAIILGELTARYSARRSELVSLEDLAAGR